MKCLIVSSAVPQKTSTVFQSLLDPNKVIKERPRYVVYAVSKESIATWDGLRFITDTQPMFMCTFN